MSPNRFDDLKADQNAKHAREQQKAASSTWSPQGLVADGLSKRNSFEDKRKERKKVFQEARSNMRSILKEFGNALWGRWRFRLTEKEIYLNQEYWWHLKGRDAEFGAYIKKTFRDDDIFAGVGTRLRGTRSYTREAYNEATYSITTYDDYDELIYYVLPDPPRAEDIEAALRKIAKEGVTGKNGIGRTSWPHELK